MGGAVPHATEPPRTLHAACPLACAPHPFSPSHRIPALLLAAAHPSSRQGRPPAGPLQDCRALEGYLAWQAHRKTFHPQAQQASPPRQGFAGTPIARRTRHAARAITQVRTCTCIRLVLVRERARTLCARASACACACACSHVHARAARPHVHAHTRPYSRATPTCLARACVR